MASLSEKELRRLLVQHGCQLRREGARHEIWFSPLTGLAFAVPRRLKGEGTLRAILNVAGIRRKEP